MSKTQDMMKKDVTRYMSICSRLHNRILCMRKVQRLIRLPEFKQKYDDQVMEDQIGIDSKIIMGDLYGLKVWLTKDNPPKTLGEMNVRELREVAKECKIPQYSRMDKETLRLEINARKNQTVT